MRRRPPKTPLAWLNLTHDARRLVTSMAGIAFAVVLMFTELGFLNALLDSTVAVINLLDLGDDDLVLLQAEKESLADTRRFVRQRLFQAEGCEGVGSARPLYLENVLSDWRNPETGDSLRIRVLAADPDDGLFHLPGQEAALAQLERPGTALFDLKSKSGFWFDALRKVAGMGGEVEAVLARKNIRVVGTFRLGTDFVNDGNLIVGLRTFAASFPLRRMENPDFPAVDLGIIRLMPGPDARRVPPWRRGFNGLLGLSVPPGPYVETVRARLEASLPGDDVVALTRAELIDREQSFWRQHTPIGPIFMIGTVLGFVVGVVICYQVLSSDIRDHLAEYATLKAVGYTNSYLSGVVFRQALWLALLGFVPGLVASAGLYGLLGWRTGLPMLLTSGRVLGVLVLTVVMCLLSAYLAIRKLFSVDPAELFR